MLISLFISVISRGGLDFIVFIFGGGGILVEVVLVLVLKFGPFAWEDSEFQLLQGFRRPLPSTNPLL